MTFETRFRRRALLAGGGAAALLPWIEALPGGRLNLANAQAQTPVKRFMVFFWPGGVIRSLFWPTGGERDFTLPYILAPLEPYREKLLILDGIDARNILDGFGHQHARGMGGLLTGKALDQGPYNFFTGGAADFPKGPSIDHVIADTISAESNKFKTLELGVLWPTWGMGPLPQNIISYSGSRQPAQPVADPWLAFRRIFEGVDGASDPNAVLRLQKTRLVLDATAAEFNAVSTGLGAADKMRLEEHLSRLSDIRASLDSTAGDNPSCVVPTNITEADAINYATGAGESHQTIEAKSSNRIPTISKQMIDMAVMAFACDRTRVSSIQYMDGASRASFPWMDLRENHHYYQHDGGFQQQPCADITRFFVQQLAYLLQRLSEVTEGDQSLLDTTAILMCSEVGDPPTHDHKRIPFVIAGNANGAFSTGRYLKFNSQSHANLLVTILNAYGVEATTHGDAKYNTGALTGLLA
jgi:hypothetical protein